MSVELQSVRPPRLERRRIRWFFAGLLIAVGASDVIEAFLVHRPLRDRTLEALLPTSVTEGSRTAVVISGLALLLLARGMANGKRAAWLLTCLVLGASAALHLVKDLDVEQAALAAWVLLGLWWLRFDFQAESDAAALKRGAATLVGGMGLAVLEAEIGALLLHNQLTPGVGPVRSLEELAYSWVGGAAYQPLSERAAWFLDSLRWVSGTLVLVGLGQLLRPVTARTAASLDERERARAVARRWAHNPVSWLALAPGNAVCWAGEGFVAYRVSGKVAIALGDPVGAPGEREQALDAFVQLCDRRGWRPAFYQVERDEAYRRRGHVVIPVGCDAVVDVAGFSLEGSQRSDLRYALRRCKRDGISFAFHTGAEAWDLAAEELRKVSAAWLTPERGPELGFSLGRLDSLDDAALTIASARREGRLVAFVSWLPVPGRSGWTLDMMRRLPDAPYGVMEALIAASIVEAGRRGLQEMSLGLVLDLQGSGIRSPAGLAGVYGWLGRLDRNRSLRLFKEKFGPRWELRYLAVADLTAVPAVLASLARVHLPGLPTIVGLVTVLRHGLARTAGARVHRLDAAWHGTRR